MSGASFAEGKSPFGGFPSGSLSVWVLKLLVLGLIDVLGIWAIIKAYDASWWPAAIFLGLVVVAAWVAWVIHRQVGAISWVELDEEIVIRKGRLFRTLVSVPYGRLQYVDIQSGPLARAFGVYIEEEGMAFFLDVRECFGKVSDAAGGVVKALHTLCRGLKALVIDGQVELLQQMFHRFKAGDIGKARPEKDALNNTDWSERERRVASAPLWHRQPAQGLPPG